MDVRVGLQRKLSTKELMLLNYGVGEDSWESLGLHGDPTQRIKSSQSQRKLVLSIYWKDWCWSWKSNALATGCEELTHWKRPWCWERLKAGGEGDDRGWDGWMASLTRCTWVWVSSGSWWWAWKPGMLQSIGSQRVRHNWLNWTDFSISTIQQNYFQALGYTVLDSPTRTGWGFVNLWGEGKYGYGTKSEPRDYESAPSMKALWQGEERNMKTMTKSEDERVRNKEENRTH